MPHSDAATSPDPGTRPGRLIYLDRPVTVWAASPGMADQMAAGARDVDAIAAVVRADPDALARLPRGYACASC